MASVYARGTSFCVRWRAAGGRQQCCTFRGPSNIKAVVAKQYIEAQGALVSRAQVYAAIDPTSSAVRGCPSARRTGRSPQAMPRPPTILVLAILTATGHIPAGLPPRAAWAAAGIDCDDLTGGLLALGIHPAGWSLPVGTVVTIPPRELAHCAWPEAPQPGIRVFVTENPSVVTAAADLSNDGPVRLLCTVGTPSALEIDAIGRLADAGWQVAVRADFDQAGLQHVASLLAGIPSAVPWRMNAADYLSSLTSPTQGRTRLDTAVLPATAWDPDLHEVMIESGYAAYEESLIDQLLDDLRKN
jgi:uncharacterized protein (TIGR02679 family)